MQAFTPEGQRFVQELAQRHGTSTEAVTALVFAVLNGGGTMAQFNHPDLGGPGQWMQGGMTMVGDMFNQGLKFRVDGLCAEISNQYFTQPGFFIAPVAATPFVGDAGSNFIGGFSSNQWWPGDLGSPSSSGGQNNVRYAVFPGSHRLAVDVGGVVTVYDTLDHQIGGVSQQQGGNDGLSFTSQYGVVYASSLPIVSGQAPQPALQSAPIANFNTLAPAPQFAPAPVYQPTAPQDGDVFAKIERLADLWQKGILTEQEFTTKKQELLGLV